jgi:transposase InsO family protein
VIADRSTSVNRAFGVQRVMRLLERSRSSVYWARSQRGVLPGPGHKRGPKTTYSDAELTDHIRSVLHGSPFVGEGHRKVWARLRIKGIRTSKQRALRLMRETGLLAPVRAARTLGPRVHDGTITPKKPNEMWGTDATGVWTEREGLVTVFAAIDHATAECVGIHAAKSATRFEALEPIRQGMRKCYGAFDANVATGLKLRHDHGSQYVSNHFQSEIAFLGIESSPSFVRSPEGNGCIERFFRTLKEQLLWVRNFVDAEDVRRAAADWIAIYNEHWLIERHGHRSPADFRRELLAVKVPA